MADNDNETVSVVECVAPRKNNWELASDWRPSGIGSQRMEYELPKPLWDAYVAARAALTEAESAIDIYVEVLHEEGDEFSRLT